MGTLAGILKINPFGERRCLGYSSWHHRPCTTRIESDDLVGGLLRLGSWRLGQGDSIERDLWQLAELVLCRRHRGLVRDFVARWMAEVCRYQERERERERERHGQIQIQSQAESHRGLPPPRPPTVTVTNIETDPSSSSSSASSLFPATTTATISYSAAPELCLQPIQSLQFDPDSFSIAGMSATSPNGDINPFHSLPSSIYMHNSAPSPANMSFTNAGAILEAPIPVVSPLSAQSLTNPPVRATTKLVHAEPKNRYAVTRRPIEGECGICTLPFSTDPDDGSFVGCIPMDVDVDDDDDDEEEEEEVVVEEEELEGIDYFGGPFEPAPEGHEASRADVELGDADDDCDHDEDVDEAEGDVEDEADEDEKLDTDANDKIVWCKVRCGTNYHWSCMNTWIRSFNNEAFRRPTCPTCRADWKL